MTFPLAAALLSLACDVSTSSNSWAKVELYQDCSFGSAALVSAQGPGSSLRSAILSQAGVLEVFDSFCDGPESQCVGARTFLVYPAPAFAAPVVAADEIQLGAAGRRIAIVPGTSSPLTIGSLEGLPDAGITEFPLRAPGAADLPWAAGISISRAWNYLVDLGFRVGGPPETLVTGPARVSSAGRACKELKVGDFYSVENGTATLRDSPAIAAALTAACN
jgi:hypothetical protein